ncbi:MAG: type III-B CRISPR module-associated protein Cmr5 [Gammaproteobacteria bacterium]
MSHRRRYPLSAAYRREYRKFTTSEASFTQRARGAELPVYQKLSRDGLAAATWLKRYAEALLKGDEE